MRSLAVLSLHTSPLAQPGTGDGGGMNVYVRELSAALARTGVECDVYTRAWSDTLPATCSVEADQISELYGGEPSRIEIVPPGVDHAFFSPGHRPQARRALGLPEDGPVLLFVGRIQPLKGARVAVETLARLARRDG